MQEALESEHAQHARWVQSESRNRGAAFRRLLAASLLAGAVLAPAAAAGADAPDTR
jgi:hypothetical protein